MANRRLFTLLCLSRIGEPALREWLFQPENLRIIFPKEYRQNDVKDAVVEADLIMGDWGGKLGIYKAEAEAATKCLLIQQPSVGVELVDLVTTKSLGIPVANAAGFNTQAVTEWVLGATLSALRSIPWADSEVRKGNWPFEELRERGGYQLFGKKVGVIGFGAIGSSVARIFSAVGCEVYYWSRTQRNPKDERGAQYLDLDSLLTTCDITCVTVAKAPETIGLVDRRRIYLLPRNAVLTDCSRGGIVDHDALGERIRNNEITGCALDVFEQEPLAIDSKLRDLSQIVLSPHGAGKTIESNLNLRNLVADNLISAVEGKALKNIVNHLPAFPRSALINPICYFPGGRF